MSEAYSIMSPSFTRPKNVRRSSLSTIGSKAVQYDDSVQEQSSPKPKILRTADVDLTAVHSDQAMNESKPQNSDHIASVHEDVKSILVRQLDVKILLGLLNGKYGPISADSESHRRSFLDDVKAALPRVVDYRRPVEAESSDEIENRSDHVSDDNAETGGTDAVPSQVGPTTGTLVRKELRPRQNLSASAAPKRGIRR